jgi:hypothetical protein
MIFEDLRKEFMKNFDLAWAYEIDKSSENLKGKQEVERHVEIWNKMAEFMDYGILVAPNLIKFIPIYFTRKFPSGKTTVFTNEGLFIPEDEFFEPGLGYRMIESKVKSEYMKMYRIHDWMPTINFNHAKECEARLLQKGKYNIINRDNSYSEQGFLGAKSIGINVVEIDYSGSMHSRDVLGKGKNELEAICDACIRFSENNKNLKREFSGVLLDNTNKHP